ncbi:RNA-directed DNA polymerase, eukaryota [Tanacetum coccineum]
MVTPAEKRDPNKYCEFHSNTGHSTDECMHLRKQIDEMIKSGKLSQFIRELKQHDKSKAPKKGETSGKDKPLAILMIQPWERMAKPRITQSFSPETAISFPLLGKEDGTEGPMIIEAEMGGYFMHRVYVDGGASSESLAVNQVPEEKINIAIHPEYPEQTVAIGSTLTKKGRKELCSLLKQNLDIFAWKPADMTGVPRNIAEHRLNIREGYSPVRQKKIGQAPERNKVIQEEVEKLVDAGIMKEVHYHSWLSNPVMVKKHDGTNLAKCVIDLQRSNNACPKVLLPITTIDWKGGVPVSRKSFKCFLDEYKWYHQIKMAKENCRVNIQHLVDKAFQRQIVDRILEINMKLNPKKCTFRNAGRNVLRLQIEDLERLVTYDEVKRAVWDCGANKSPGPDGFTFEFFRKFWKTLDQDVFQAVSDFFENGHIPRGCNASFIALIPKIHDAKIVKDFRPISLIGSIYKIITKILANRLCNVLPCLISEVQSAFVSNRNILDGPFILDELLQWCKHKRKRAMIFKVDFEKAFDSVKWDYLIDTLRAFGFGQKWCSWINGCFETATGSVLVNGSPTSEFQFHRGLKQGDPISPFLFILIMETLHLSFKRVIEANLFKGISINASFSISHLFYADDVVFIGEWNSSNIKTVAKVLNCFYLASGLKINFHKSKLMGVGVNSNEVESVANLVGCSTFSSPFKYLGVIVGDNMSRLKPWEDVISKVSNRLSNWKLKTLSIGGRLTLIKSVISSIPLYHMSIFKAPMGVLNKLESIRRNFFNGIDGMDKKNSWIGWDKILASKKNGGLGVSSLYATNRALLFKWIWRFFSQDSSWWSRFIQAMHGNHGALSSCVTSLRRSPWLDIIREMHALNSKGIDLMQFLKKKLGNGENTSFWDDKWHDDGPFKSLYPRLHALETCKSISVASKLSQPSLIHSFRRPPRGGVEEEQFSLLGSRTTGISLPNMCDRWFWSLESSGDFSVKSTRICIDDNILPKNDVPTRWVKIIPIKVNIHAWKVFLDKIPTRLNLSLRGMDIPSILCPLYFGFPSNSDKTLNKSLLDLKKVDGYMVRGEEDEKELVEMGEVGEGPFGKGESGEFYAKHVVWRGKHLKGVWFIWESIVVAGVDRDRDAEKEETRRIS